MEEIVTRQLVAIDKEVLRELEAYRLEHHLTHTEIARMCGISYSRYTAWRATGICGRVMLMRKSYGFQPSLLEGQANETA